MAWRTRSYIVHHSGIPFGDVSADGRSKADHCEAQLVGSAQNETKHDRNERQLYKYAVLFFENYVRYQRSEQRRGTLDCFNKRNSDILEGYETKQNNKKPDKYTQTY